MNLIEKDELRDKIERGDAFKLVMVLGEWAFRPSTSQARST